MQGLKYVSWYWREESGVEMPESWENRKTYDLYLPFKENWFNQQEKILIVTDYVFNLDLKDGRLLGSSQMATMWGNLIKYSIKYSGAKTILPYGFINLNYFKTFDLSPDERREANKFAARRVLYFINKYKPTRVALVGDDCSKVLSELLGVKDPYLLNKRGQCIPVEYKGHTFSLVTAFAPQNVLSEDGRIADNDKVILYANLLGYTGQTLSSVWINQRKYQIPETPIKPIYIDDIEKFDKFFDMLLDATSQGKPIALDVETVGLTVYDNPILTIQFAFSAKRGFFLPLNHRDSPFSPRELNYMVKKLRSWLGKKDVGETYLIGHNLKFDLRILRQYFGIPYIYYPVWCTLAAEYLLNENQVGLKNFGTPAYGLAQVLASYGNYHYYTAAFSKKDRMTIANVPLTLDVIQYGVADVQLDYALHQIQCVRAADMDFDGNSYLPYYRKAVLRLMSNIVSTMSLLEQRGTTIDLNYLMSQLATDSQTNVIIAEAEKKFDEFESVKKVNSRLVKDKGIPSNGLFGKVSTNLFNIAKEAHKQMLFFDILGLKPLKIGKKGVGCIDKIFQKEYSDVPEVATLTKLNKIKKLKSSYIDAFYNFVGCSHDGKKDSRLRAGFGFQDIVTGRSNSFKPSLQQIPEHGEFAKIIKRMFVAPEGKLIVKMDASAHEVRCLHLDNYIDTLSGKIQLGRLLEMKNPPLIKSFNHDTGVIEYRPLGYRSKHVTKENMLNVTYEGGSAKLTENHEVWSVTRGQYVCTKDLLADEEVIIDEEN